MHHDHHLEELNVFECTGGIEVIGRADSTVEHWRLMFVGDQFGEWTLLNTIDDTLGLHAFTLIETGIVALKPEDSMNISLVEWSPRQSWERKATIPVDTNTTGWSLSPYENNQVIVSRQENGRTLVSIFAVGTGSSECTPT